MNIKRLRAVLYARYSTSKQKVESLEDQFHVCERIADREGFLIVGRFGDREISGGTADRPQYQAMLAAARDGQFDVIVAEDISRLWRNRAEFGPRSAELEDLNIHMVTAVGDDTRKDGFGLTIQIKLAIAENARREASYRTRRGQEGLARARKPTGGIAYGYIAAKDSTTGLMEIHQERAAVVRRIFELYADGKSPRAICNLLNSEHLPSPGATQKRTDQGPHRKSKDKLWLAAALNGQAENGTGLLNNRRYIGEVVWGRTKWQRSAANSDLRTPCKPDEKPIEYEDERLRIVASELLDRVKARQKQVAHASEGIRNALRAKKGRPARHLLSGLLRCSFCSSKFVRVDKRRYGCATHTNGGRAACANDFKLNAADAERVVLEFITQGFLSPEAIGIAITEYNATVKNLRIELGAKGTVVESDAALSAVEREIEQLKQLVRAGTMSAARLQPAIENAENERAKLLMRTVATQDSHDQKVARLLPDAVAAYRAKLASLDRAREELTDGEYTETRGLVFDMLGGGVTVVPHEGGSSTLKLEVDIEPIARAYGSMAYKLVAGAGFEPATFGL